MVSPDDAPGPSPRSTAAEDPTHYLYERYLPTKRRSRLLAAYYLAKRVLPRRLQLALRRAYARRQAEVAFPAWPIEPILVNRRDDVIREQLRRTGDSRIPLVNFWPHGNRFAFILTHDVEGPAGVANIPRLLDIERRHGFVASYNFVAEDYPIAPDVFELVLSAGGEVGLHGIRHDARLFQSRETFEADLPKIHRYLRDWSAVGFRSPATHRRAEWMHELGCLYDSSFHDTAPFEPQRGGCCSILPFHFGDVVELPITLVMDHTLFEILRDESIDRWVDKSEWLIAHHGLINVLTHPDYLLSEERLDLYDQFLAFLARQRGAWHALPREVAEWWNTRTALSCEPTEDGGARIVGGPDESATVAWASEMGGDIVLDTRAPSVVGR
jgi:peptidoglycan/xylan/chitin deacetylase (PgdA/CDA1 family)